MSVMWHSLWHRLFSGSQRKSSGIYNLDYRDASREAHGYASSMVPACLSHANRTMIDGQR